MRNIGKKPDKAVLHKHLSQEKNLSEFKSS